MKRKHLSLLILLFFGSPASVAISQQSLADYSAIDSQNSRAGRVRQTSFGFSKHPAPCDAAPVDCDCEFLSQRSSCDCGEPVCGCEVDCGCESACGDASYWEPTCDGGCDGPSLLSSCGSIFADLIGDAEVKFGGWVQLGYHSNSAAYRFNDSADSVRLHQAYLYFDEKADGGKGLSFGKHIDYVYGIDGPDTQAFGQDSGWDTQWDNGGNYGHAIPQAYGTVAYGDTEVKIGHFYTLIGYEVVTATGNFFYSHSYTMFNSEPFTHTGALVTHKASEDITLYGGYVLGWDSGFEDNGDAFLGGATLVMTSDVTLTYSAIGGRFNEADAGGSIGVNERGYMQSLIASVQLSEKLKYIFWTDYLTSKDDMAVPVRDTFDLNNYLLYTLSDKVSLGSRFEWWNVKGSAFNVNNGHSDIYAFTFGANVSAASSLLVRPEIRWDWDGDRLGVNEVRANDGLFKKSQATIGIDAIYSF